MKLIFINELLLAEVNNAEILRPKNQKVKVTGTKMPKIVSFLADRTNGRAYATVLRLSVRLSSSVVVVVCLSVTLCIVAKRCVLEQKLLLRAYRKSYMRNRLVPK